MKEASAFMWESIIFWFCILFLSGISREPCNNWHYLGHSNHIDDDDDNDDDDDEHLEAVPL